MFTTSRNRPKVPDPALAIVILFMYLSLVGQPGTRSTARARTSLRRAGIRDRKKHVKPNELPVRNRRTGEIDAKRETGRARVCFMRGNAKEIL